MCLSNKDKNSICLSHVTTCFMKYQRNIVMGDRANTFSEATNLNVFSFTKCACLK